MARILVELTNRCNLRCGHCYDERHAASGDLALAVLDKIVAEGKDCGIEHIVFTGGEPTLHHEFARIVHRVAEAGYGFSFVSNGTTFPKIYTLLLRHLHAFRGVTFSLDGAHPGTHDRLRGKGSFRRVMRAATLCVFKQLPFTLNMVVTAHNRHEIPDMVHFAAKLGSSGLRFGHLISTPGNAERDLDLSPRERREVEAQIWRLRERAELPVDMAPGHYSESFFFPCGPLKLDEHNVDYRGNMTLCCQLSGIAGCNSGDEVMGNLHDVSLAVACERFRERVGIYLEDKREKVRRNELGELDHFPCWYCIKYMGKAVSSADDAADADWFQRGAHTGKVDVVFE